MLLDVDLILQGIVISSIFLMVFRYHELFSFSLHFVSRFLYILGLTNKNSIISKNPVRYQTSKICY